MSFVSRKAAHCDQCGHEWLVENTALRQAGQMPVHCAKCKTRRWNEPPAKKARAKKAGR